MARLFGKEQTFGLRDGAASFDDGSDDISLAEQWSAKDRSNFVKKVFGILGVQLLFTAFCVAVTQFMFLGVSTTPMSNPAVQAVGTLSSFGAMAMCCVIFCNPDLCRKTPTNYIVLSLFTICEAGVCSFIALQYAPQSVAQVALLTAGLTIALSVYATYTESDFTGCGPMLFACLMGVLLCSFLLLGMGLCGLPINVPIMCLNACIALLTCFFIIYDIQMIMGGKNRASAIGVDDYILGSLMLYMDIVRLFITLLQLFGERRN